MESKQPIDDYRSECDSGEFVSNQPPTDDIPAGFRSTHGWVFGPGDTIMTAESGVR